MLTIGRRGGKDFKINDEERSRHLHVVGASGTGKSRFLEMLVRQDIYAGRGVCVIDPHGPLADSVMAYCASLNMDRRRRIHLVELADPEWCLGFNPLHADGVTDTSFRTDAMLDTFSEVWGGEETDKTPLLATCLELVFYALVTNRLTLVEANALTRGSDEGGVRTTLTEGLPDFVYDDYWKDIRTLSRHDLEERFASTRRRLLRFVGRPIIRRVVGQSKVTINLRRMMDEGEILIVNLASKGVVSEAAARVIGALLLSEFRLAAISRTEEIGRRHPYYVVVDECYDYLTGDVERMLDETRKFGLHLTLAHQRLGQLRRRSEAIYNGVMTGAQTKVVFGGLTDDDAEIMAREIMRTSFDLERPKHSLDKPVVVGHERIWLRGYNTSDGYVDTAGTVEGENWAAMSGASTAAGQTFAIDADGNPTPYPVATQEVSGTSDAFSRGGFIANTSSHGTTHNDGRNTQEALGPILETMTTQVHSLEEEVHRSIVRLREQPNQRAIVKLRSQKARGVTIPNVPEPLVRRERVQELKARIKEQSAHLTPRPTVDAEIEERRVALGHPPHQDVPDNAPPFEEPKWG